MIASQFLTVLEAAGILRVSPDTVYRWIKSGALPVFRQGHILRVPEIAVGEFIAARTSTPKASPARRSKPKATARRPGAVASTGSEVLDPQARVRLIRAEGLRDGEGGNR